MLRRLSTAARLAIAGGMLSVSLLAGLGAASAGELRVGAGDMSIQLGRGERGFLIQVSLRDCAYGCGIDVNWKPERRRGPAPI
jgi:hypothetical protein